MQDSLQLIIDSIRQSESYEFIVDSLNHVASDNSYAQEAANENLYKTFLAVTSAVAIFGTFIYLQFINKVYWDRGVYPPFKLNRPVNRYDAVVYLAVIIIRLDSTQQYDKRVFLKEFMVRNYRGVKRNLNESISLACARMVSTKSVSYWLNKYMTVEAEKTKLLDFLVNLAALDGQIGPREQAELRVFCQQMKLSETLLEQLITQYRRARAEKLHEKQQRSTKRTVYASVSLKEKHMATLELSEDFTEEALKKAYRKLAKAYHPDVAVAKNEAELATLQQRFLEIQEAYEFLNDQL